jgi:hypothetical protein
LAVLAEIPFRQGGRITVLRLYDGTYRVGFPDHQSDRCGCVALRRGLRRS